MEETYDVFYRKWVCHISHINRIFPIINLVAGQRYHLRRKGAWSCGYSTNATVVDKHLRGASQVTGGINQQRSVRGDPAPGSRPPVLKVPSPRGTWAPSAVWGMAWGASPTI